MFDFFEGADCSFSQHVENQQDLENNSDKEKERASYQNTEHGIECENMFKTYLHTLNVLKATNSMLRRENKELYRELNLYKKKMDEIDG